MDESGVKRNSGSTNVLEATKEKETCDDEANVEARNVKQEYAEYSKFSVKEESVSRIGEEEKWMKKVPNLISCTPDRGEVLEMKTIYKTDGLQLVKEESAEMFQGPSEIKVKVNIIPGSNSEEEERAVKKRMMYKEEKLMLVCEWNGCGEEQSNPDVFSWHVGQHCNDAEVQHIPPPLEDCFLCLWADCGFKTPSSEEMVRHINFHGFHAKIKAHGQALLERENLSTCSLSQSQRNLLPDLSSAWTCHWPGCLSSGNWTMPQHFYLHLGDHADSLRGQKPLQCLWPACEVTVSAVSKLREHMRCHSQEKLVACPTCGGLFSNRAKFLDHVRRQNVGKLQYPCKTCGKAFPVERLLRDHMRSHVNQYQCPACDMTCPTPSTLATHMRYRHTTERPLACQFCEYRGKTKADMRSHARVHYTEDELRCKEPGCDFTCRAALTLVRHQENQHSIAVARSQQQYGCHLCNAVIKDGNKLSRHLVSEHGLVLPPGHSRFRYQNDPGTGLLSLRTSRVESDLLVAAKTAPLV